MKQCSSCKTIKPLEDFNKKNSSKDGLCYCCRDCNKKRLQQHYIANKPTYKARSIKNNKKYSQRNREFVYEYLLKHPCVDCGEVNPVKLEFDHRKDKEYDVSRMIQASFSIQRLELEIDKCDVRCANCHRVKTAQERDYWIYNKAMDDLRVTQW